MAGWEGPAPAEPRLSPEDEAALRQMLGESAPEPADLRAEGDAHWLANGVLIELHGLGAAAHLNGLRGEVVGYDDGQRRYRVRLQSDQTVKVVAKKNMRLCVDAAALAAPCAPGSLGGAASEGRGASGLQRGPPSVGQIALAAQTQRAEVVPSREALARALRAFERERGQMLERCEARRAGGEGVQMCEGYLALLEAWSAYEEAVECYRKYWGEDPAVKEEYERADASMESCQELYHSVRTWTEMALDEANTLKHNISRHGVVGTLKSEVVGMGTDVAEVAQAAAETAPRVHRIVRQGTASLGGAVAQSVGDIRTTASQRREQAGGFVREQVTAPIKRAWHLLLMAFFMCFVVPLFALRTYAPMNSVVSNLGLVYGAWCVACPPRWAQQRPQKAGLLLLYPLVLVVLPLLLHYWVTHPPSGQRWQRPSPLPDGLFPGLPPAPAPARPAPAPAPRPWWSRPGAQAPAAEAPARAPALAPQAAAPPAPPAPSPEPPPPPAPGPEQPPAATAAPPPPAPGPEQPAAAPSPAPAAGEEEPRGAAPEAKRGPLRALLRALRGALGRLRRAWPLGRGRGGRPAAERAAAARAGGGSRAFLRLPAAPPRPRRQRERRQHGEA